VSDTLLRSKVPVTETADKSGTEPEPASLRVPAEIVVELVYALTASVTNTPVPDLVNVEIGVSIGSDTVMLPAPVNVIAGVPLVASNALPEATSKVNVPAELPIVAAAFSVTALVTELLFARLSKAPVPEPLPPIVKGSETESSEPSKCTAPVLLTSVIPAVVPSAAFLATLSTPAETLVVPVYVLSLEPDNLSVLAPDLVTAPSPEITPENVCVVPAVALENVNVLPTDVMAMLPLYDALVPSVPDTVMLPPDAAMVVLPE
jgi:hypothetical protein